MAAFAEPYFVILFPFRKEILQRVPLLAHLFPFFFWFQQGVGSRRISVNKQLLKLRNSVCLTQDGPDFVIRCGPRSSAVRQIMSLDWDGCKPGPYQPNDEAIFGAI